MRKFLLGLAALAILAAACAPEEDPVDPAGSGGATEPAPVDAASCAADATLVSDGSLTIATGNPAYKPWYGGKSIEGSEWESGGFTGDPHTGQGYEAAFAYALAEELGFSEDELQWLGIPFNKSFAPGPKDFDFSMQQVSITEKRAGAVDFSVGYFDVNQALIANEGSPAIGATTLAELKDLKLGAPIGTTSLDVIEELVQPTEDATVYDDLDLALKDLKNGQVDGVVVDFPTAFYGYADVVVGQFPDLGEQEQFGLTFEKGNTFVECVDLGIEALAADGTLDALKEEWLETDTSVPTFS